MGGLRSFSTMDFKAAVKIGVVLGIAVLASVATAQPASAQRAPAQRAPAQDLALKGDAVCTRCHDASDIDPVLKIGKTKHGTRADSRTPTCTSCHGESTDHIARPRKAKVDIGFTKASAGTPSERSGVCQQCHSGKKRMFWDQSTHQARDVTCANCHDVHSDRDKALTKTTQTEVCFGCHKDTKIKVSMRYRHPINEGKVACSDCHNPHGSAGPSMLVRDNVVDTCYQCHAEKRGPFLWQHQPVTEDCSTCHNPHGTAVASMLKWRQPFLCQQCHEATSHRGMIPNFGRTGTSGIDSTAARGCVNCHANIHGGNNPTNNSRSRQFRR